jgi:cell division protease FtsH
MAWYWITLLALAAALAGGGLGFSLARRAGRRRGRGESAPPVRPLLEAHFRSAALDQITVSERRFPFRVRADLQKALDRLLADAAVLHFCGVRKEHSFDGLNFAALLAAGHSPAVSVPPEYEAVDVGDDEPVRCLRAGLWLLDRGGTRLAVLLGPAGRPYGEPTGVQFQVAAPNDPDGTRLAGEFFRRLEEAVQRADSYRGKVLSLEQAEHSYSGESAGITVHRLGPVPRDQVILPAATLDLLDRNVVRFAEQRPRLRAAGQPTRKGLLFYGPPGTGKTLTIRYLAHALPGHTTLLVSAEQVGLLGEYMTLARLLQPSIVVLEDVDLIARDRAAMNSPCEEVMLNKLLNEMDGLKEEADILFVLTTNRPEALEAALASRPGRVDQAIEFPLPDADGRRKLVRLYARGAAVAGGVEEAVVRRTDGVSAAFIKELMRRAVQFGLERDGPVGVDEADMDRALDEMLFRGGSLNLKLLGAAGATGRAVCDPATPT